MRFRPKQRLGQFRNGDKDFGIKGSKKLLITIEKNGVVFEHVISISSLQQSEFVIFLETV